VKENENLLDKHMFKWLFTVQQRCELEKAFAENEQPKGKELGNVAENLQLSKKQVSNWFIHRRKKKKKVAEAVASDQDMEHESPQTKHTLVQEKSWQIRHQREEVDGALVHDQNANMQESSVDMLASACKIAVKCESGPDSEGPINFGGVSSKRSKKYSLSAFQVAELAEAFAEEEYIVGKRLANLAENLQLSKKQVMVWFSNKRISKWKKEEALIGKMMDVSEAWPTPDDDPLPEEEVGAVPIEVTGGYLKDEIMFSKESQSESEIVTSLAENIGQVERKVEEVLASVAVPLLSLPLSHQEMLRCLARLNNASLNLGPKAAFLLVITDQVVVSVKGGLAGLFQVEGQPPRDVEFVRKTLVAEHLVKKLGEVWRKLFVGIHTAPQHLKLPANALDTLEKTLLRHYKQLRALAPNLALHLSSKEAALAFSPNHIIKESIATVTGNANIKAKETVASTLTMQRT